MKKLWKFRVSHRCACGKEFEYAAVFTWPFFAEAQEGLVVAQQLAEEWLNDHLDCQEKQR